MEFLKVIFRETRGVLIDGKRSNQTNVVIEREAGTYTISLDPPPDFKPKEIKLALDPGTTGPLSPKEVSFEKI
jgi:hypothetical protein